jgi:hypothetical protein
MAKVYHLQDHTHYTQKTTTQETGKVYFKTEIKYVLQLLVSTALYQKPS